VLADVDAEAGRNSGSRSAMLRATSNTSRAWSPVVAAL
jgi:hypothetical protein